MSDLSVAFIPARGGSKGIPRKNIKVLGEKPLIVWSIEAALETGIFHKVIVTTDDNEIADIARQYGAEVPFLRPTTLAADDTPTLPVLVHAMQWLEKHEPNTYQQAVLLEPTFPLRKPQDIIKAVELLKSTQVDSVVSVIPVEKHMNPNWQFTIGHERVLRLFTGEEMGNIIPRRQDLPDTYIRNGAIYVIRTALLLQQRPSLYGIKSAAYIMDEQDTIDINTDEDWARAEEIVRQFK